MPRTLRVIDTPYGEAHLHVNRAKSPIATLLLCHGAGAGIDTPDLLALDKGLPRHGISVLRLEQPWRVAGRRIATPPPTLDVALRATGDQLRSRHPLIVGGRSAGARSAARSARTLGASGCLAISFPLHPPGQPEKSRLDELAHAAVPTLVIQGEKDPMGRPEEFPRQIEMCVVPGGDHSLRVPKRGSITPKDAMAIVVEATLEWIVREVTGNPMA